MCVMFHLHACLCAPHAPSAHGGQKRVLGTQPRSCATATRDLNHLRAALAPACSFFMRSKIQTQGILLPTFRASVLSSINLANPLTNMIRG